MSYYFSKTLQTNFDDAIQHVTEVLKQHGFGIITEIDVTDTFKKKIGKDFRRYRILGACNPNMAYEALQLEDKVGTMLPCNLVVQETSPGHVEVAAIDPIASMQAIPNDRLQKTALQVQQKLRDVVSAL
jgi:uncharacterized protein (DUF302 family)